MFDIKVVQGIFIALTISLAILFCIIVVVLQLNRLQKTTAKQRKRKAQAVIDGILTPYLIDVDNDGEVNQQEVANQLRQALPLKKKWSQELLVSTLIDLEANLKGKIRLFVLELYQTLMLQQYSLRLMHSKLWYIKIKGIYQLRQMKYAPALEAISAMINSENHHLRSSALMAYLSMKEEQPLSILKSVKGNVNKMDEIRILEMIKSKRLKRPEDIDSWLDSPNDSVVKLTLRIMAYYNYAPREQLIKRLLKSPVDLVRKEAIMFVRKLYMHKFEKRLIKMYKEEPYKNQLQVIITLGAVGGDFSLLLLDNIVFDEGSTSEAKYLAMKAIQQIDPVFLDMKFVDMDEFYQKIKSHVKDPLL